MHGCSFKTLFTKVGMHLSMNAALGSVSSATSLPSIGPKMWLCKFIQTSF